MKKPKKFLIINDEYSAKYVGKTNDGRQFFLTTPFLPDIDGYGREFIALYVFDKSGTLIESEIIDIDQRGKTNEKTILDIINNLIIKLGKIKYTSIKIEPFEIIYEGIKFGMILNDPEDPEDEYVIIAEPGNYMAFNEPWDSGEYDT